MSRNFLNLWLHGQHLGEVEQLRNGRTRLRFTDEATARWGTGTRLLSFSLPLTSRRVESQALDDYLDNLLPEGGVRTADESLFVSDCTYPAGLRSDSRGLPPSIDSEASAPVITGDR